MVDEIFPHLTSLRSNISLDNNGITTTETEEFDYAVGSIVNTIISYNMGWSKRGNGKSYDSLNGYGTIIGYLTGKILDFATRNRKCRLCAVGKIKVNMIVDIILMVVLKLWSLT